jgi:hypothetical protein
MLPLTWIFNFSRGFLVGTSYTPEAIEFIFPEVVSQFFDVIPYFSIILTGVGFGLGILFLAFIFKKIIHI